ARPRALRIQKVINEVIALITSLARHINFGLFIEDTGQADNATLQFLEQLALRAREIPLTVVLTNQAGQGTSSWIEMFEDCLGEDFVRFFLLPLSEPESKQLVDFLEAEPERRDRVLKASAGNPFFIQEYSKSRKENIDPAAILMTTRLTLSNLSNELRSVL